MIIEEHCPEKHDQDGLISSPNSEEDDDAVLLPEDAFVEPDDDDDDDEEETDTEDVENDEQPIAYFEEDDTQEESDEDSEHDGNGSGPGALTTGKVPTLKKETVQPLGMLDSVLSTETSEDNQTENAVEKIKPQRREKRWYIVHTYSGHENKVKMNLERRIESMNMGQKIFRVEVPQKTVTKIKDGKRQEKDERLFPGYVLVEMVMDDDSWYVVRHTPGVTKFVGSEKKPIPARDSEIKRILLRSVPVSEKVEIDLKAGENIRIISGPFAEFEGTVTEVYPDKEKIKANVSIFGRDTPVELVFSQIQKV